MNASTRLAWYWIGIEHHNTMLYTMKKFTGTCCQCQEMPDKIKKVTFSHKD